MQEKRGEVREKDGGGEERREERATSSTAGSGSPSSAGRRRGGGLVELGERLELVRVAELGATPAARALRA